MNAEALKRVVAACGDAAASTDLERYWQASTNSHIVFALLLTLGAGLAFYAIKRAHDE